MSFAALSGLWLGLIAIPVVALYILKIKRHVRVVPYLRLWEKLVADQRFTSLWRRLQRLLSLLLQLAIAVSLVGAFAMLTLSDSFLREDSVVIVLDTSASMQAMSEPASARSRLDVALERARGLVEGRSSEDEIAVVAAGEQPEVLQGFTRSTLRLREALGAIKPTCASGDIVAAHRLAKDLLQGKKYPRILLLSDAAAGESERLAKSDPDTRWLRMGKSVPNLAIVRFQARKNHAVGTDYLLTVVTNFSDRPARATLEISVESSTKKVLPLELAAGEEKAETIELDLPEGGFARAQLVFPAGPDGKPGRDGLAVDDFAFAAIAEARLYKVLLVAVTQERAEPFKAAFSALKGFVDPQQSRIATLEEWDAKAEDNAKAYDLVLFVDTAPKELPATGSYLAINALPGGLPAKELGIERQPVLKDADPAQPMNRFLEVGGMQPASARPLDLSGGQVFLATSSGPIGVVFQSKQRRVIYLGIDLVSDLFFLQVAFPVLVRNALAWMHEEESALLDPSYAPGQVMRPRSALADAAVEATWFHERTRSKGTVSVPVTDGKFFFSDTREPGRYAFRTSRSFQRTAVNLFDARESDLAMPAEDKTVGDADLERSGFLFGRDAWPLLLLVAAVAWLLEWGLFHRRITE